MVVVIMVVGASSQSIAQRGALLSCKRTHSSCLIRRQSGHPGVVIPPVVSNSETHQEGVQSELSPTRNEPNWKRAQLEMSHGYPSDAAPRGPAVLVLFGWLARMDMYIIIVYNLVVYSKVYYSMVQYSIVSYSIDVYVYVCIYIYIYI